jgi:hypothetical protein
MTNKSISQLTAGGAVSSTDLFPDVQTVGVGPVKVTAAQIGDYVLSGSGLTGVLPVSRGGTGLTSLTAGRIPYGNGTSAFSSSASLTYNGSSQLVFGGSNAGGYNSLTINNSSSTGYAQTVYQIGAAGANGIAGFSYAPGLFYLLGITANDTTTPITFYTSGSEKMRLDASGNVGIGTSSPGARLDVLGPSSATSFTGTTRLGVTVRGSTGATDYSGIDFIGNNQTNPTARIAVLTGGAGSSLSFGTSNSYGSGITNTAMTLDASGSLAVGSILDGGKLTLSGTAGFAGTGLSIFETSTGNSARLRVSQNAAEVVYDATFSSGGNAHVWRTGGTERARIDSSGRLLVGTTSATIGGATTTSFGVQADMSTDYGITMNSTSASGNQYFHNWGSNGTQRAYMFYDAGAGFVKFTGQASATYSDKRLKNVTGECEYGLAALLQIETKRFNWKRNGVSDIGALAQDLHRIIPEAVEVGSDGELNLKDFHVDDVWKVKEEKLTIPIIKAIQELAAKVTALEEQLNG